MRARTFNYFIKEGIKSFWKNGLMSMASVVTATLCLVLFGIYVLFSMNINYIAVQVEANYEIQVFLNDTTQKSRTEQISEEIKTINNVNNVTFVSREEAFEEWKTHFDKDSELFEGLELDNPLRDSYKVTLNNLKSVDETVSQIESIANVDYVKNNKSTMDKLVNITGIIKNVSFWFMIFFALIAIFIISNAIRLTVFARRKEVNIMKFVGATDLFISLPFMVEGVMIGIIGALISLVTVSEAYNYFLNASGKMFGSTIKLYETQTTFGILLGSLAGMGIILGAVGSAISLRRHLHV